MANVQILPPNVASQIAAGEVVNRPASVVKELVENAVDAGATSITVVLTDAGRTMIQVTDNGCGMDAGDAAMAFERHATSKIRESDDLYSLCTFGFRGEALPSIAAVAQVTLKTRTADSETGTAICIEGGEKVSSEPCVCPVGSTFTVRNLFYNVPARRKFLKSNQTELGHIMTEIERLALSHPDVAVELFHQGEQLLSLPATSAIKQRIVSLFGKKMNQALLPVDVSTSVISVHGFTSTLDSVRGKGAQQFFFVNGRFMKHAYFHKAVTSAYENLVPDGEQPSYFLFLEVPGDTVDVNVHPSKTEIKFQDEPVLWKIIMAAVKETVGKFEDMPTIDFNTADMPDIPVFDSSRPASQPKVEYNPAFNPFSSGAGQSGNRRSTEGWSKLYGDAVEHKLSEVAAVYERPSDSLLQPEESTPVPFQFAERYIIVTCQQGLMVVDQHRAHMRILYERYLSGATLHNAASQGLLFPEMFQLSPADTALFAQLKPRFAALGFDISDMGRGAVAVQGIPSGLENQDYERLISDMLHDLLISPTNDEDRQLESMALAMARRSAIPSGRTLSVAEMQEILTSLKACSMPSRTPDGKTTYVVRSMADIAKWFD